VLVTDAGVWVRALVDEAPGDPIRTRLVAEPAVVAPALIDLDFTNVLRGLLAKGSIALPGAELALAEFLQAPIQRYSHESLVPRVWQLRQNLTAYDAAYVALAEALGVDLLTIDRGIGGAPGIRCRVITVQ
jgi:predicted nucleic acid-binding protein